ncbi:collagenase [Trinickia sp. LjRoot230]|uniref:collagenase n=1 Tax=Trinickia sp. LjRoot230 TaxID=3342288 RepID=UPI003ECFC2DC
MGRLRISLSGGLWLFAMTMAFVGSALAAPYSHASGDVGMVSKQARLPPMPRTPSMLPRTREAMRYDLAPSKVLRPELMTSEMRRRLRDSGHLVQAETAACPSMAAMAGYSGAELAEAIAALPDSSCANAFFSVTAQQATQLFSNANMTAVATRFASASAAYAPGDRTLVNVALFLRAAYYLASEGSIAPIAADVLATVRPAIMQLLTGSTLFSPNEKAQTTAGEVVTLIVNMHDEAAYLDVMKRWVERFTNTPAAPNAARLLDDPNVGYGFTGILKVFYFAHYRPEALPKIESDPSYASSLYAFVRANKQSLLDDNNASYQLNQAAGEAFRFAMHPALLPTVSALMRDALAGSTMAGPDRLIWLAAAQAVNAYDNDNCNAYGTCNFEARLADAILSRRYSCPGKTVHLRAESLDSAQAKKACSTVQQEAPFFHAMLHTNRVPVANDGNAKLEVVVFSSNVEYENYSGVLFGNDTDNGGVYLEGDPASPTNQARFIAYVATWLSPTFEIWNLKHEYVHYLDGRFDLYGDFEQSTRVPTVWYIEGLAEYISRGNDDPESIEAAMTGRYRLSEIFKNDYDMVDYVSRAYRWGYMATRFIFERHPEVLAAILPMFRSGDYAAYWAFIQRLSPQLDDEFSAWVPTVTTAGTPAPPWHSD